MAEQVIKNAQAGHAESVDFVVDVANELKKQTGAKPIASANANEDTDTSNPDKDNKHKYCVEQWQKDIEWCDSSYRGRTNIACHNWASDELARCRHGSPRQPFRF